MGRFLQIRVSAATWRPEDLLKAWPRLTALAWPDEAPAEPGGAPKGVLELVDRLRDMAQFGDVPKDAEPVVSGHLPALVRDRDALEQALADWKPSQANDLSVTLEEGLAALDKALPKG